MRKPLISVGTAVLAALLVAAAGAFVAVQPAASAPAAVRIMPLGDSITAGTGCWRAMLWHQLQTAGHTNIDFVGGVSDGGGCNPGYSYDFDHEGHGGFSATGIADNNQLPPWLNAAMPDIVLMHLGTNDMWGHYIPTTTKLTAFTKLVGQMRANNPNVKIVVAQIIPMSASSCSTCPADIIEFNNALPGWAAGLHTTQSPIVLVDQWTGFDPAVDTGDGVHPNTSGYQKMANRWQPALARILGGVTSSPSPSLSASASPSSSPSPSASPSRSASPSPSASPSRSVSPSPSPSASGSATCAATYKIVSQWGGGFQGEITVRNTGATTSSAWTVTFSFANGQQVNQAWSATLSQVGAAVTARNVSYNGSLAAGATTSFGFLASLNGVNTAPVVACAAG